VYTPFSDSETGTTLPEYFGNIQLFCIDTAANAGAGSLDSNCSDATLDGHLTINVNQTVPDTETGAFIGALSGGATGGGGVLIFFPSSFNLDGGDLTFQLQPTIFSTGGLGGIPQGESSSGGVTTIQGRVTDNSTSTPEPASSAFVAIGLLSLCFAARRNLA
jgi:hypothetical protein